MITKRSWVITAVLLSLAFTASAYAQIPSPTEDSSNLPTVNLITPDHGPASGGTKVAIVGLNIGSATAVNFGSTAATSFKRDTPTSVTAFSPPGTGTVDVTVTTPDGTSVTTSADQFTYGAVPQPVVDALHPATGPIIGGTKVQILGEALSRALAVDFGSTPASSLSHDSEDQITAVSAAGTGTVDVTVTTAGGVSDTTTADQFTYVTEPPSINEVTPSRGATSGGTTVTVTGENFDDVSTVEFGTAPAESFDVDSVHRITAVSPAGKGSVDITVTTSQGTSTVVPGDRFDYGFPPPSVTSISPKRGADLGGTRVTIVGSRLADASAVDFGSIPATNVKVHSDETITAVAPSGTGTVDITVTTAQGTSATSSSDQFTYFAHLPVVETVLPSTGSPGGGTVVTIIGTSFNGASAVSFGGTPAASFELDSNRAVTATSPPGTGTVDISVTTPEGTSAAKPADKFTYG